MLLLSQGSHHEASFCEDTGPTHGKLLLWRKHNRLSLAKSIIVSWLFPEDTSCLAAPLFVSVSLTFPTSLYFHCCLQTVLTFPSKENQALCLMSSQSVAHTLPLSVGLSAEPWVLVSSKFWLLTYFQSLSTIAAFLLDKWFICVCNPFSQLASPPQSYGPNCSLSHSPHDLVLDLIFTTVPLHHHRFSPRFFEEQLTNRSCIFLKCTIQWFDICIYCEKIITTKFIHPSHHTFRVCVCAHVGAHLLRTCKVFSDSKVSQTQFKMVHSLTHI